jgi:hypothetical protein
VTLILLSKGTVEMDNWAIENAIKNNALSRVQVYTSGQGIKQV